MDNNILTDKLIELIKKNAYGKSVSYPSGWIKAETLSKIIKLIEDGSIDRFGEIKSLDGISI